MNYYTYKDMIPGQYYQFGDWVMKYHNTSDEIVESYPNVFSNVHYGDFYNVITHEIKLNERHVYNIEAKRFTDVDFTFFEEKLNFLRKKIENLQSKETSFIELFEKCQKK